MPKYDYDFKMKCVDCLDNHKPLPKFKGVLDKTILRNAQTWRILLRKQEKKGLDNSIIFKNYTLKDKINAVKRVVNGESYTSVGRSIGMRCHSTVRRWYLDYLRNGIAGLQYKKGIKPVTSVEESTKMKKRITRTEKEELISLRKRNEILEIENEYLKKLDALVSKREKEEAKAKKQK